MCCLKVFATPRDTLPPQSTLVSTVLVAAPIQAALSKNTLSGDHPTRTSHVRLAHSTVLLLSVTFFEYQELFRVQNDIPGPAQ